MPNPVVHFQIESSDPDKTREFFTDVFGWQIRLVPEIDYALVDTQSDTGIMGGIGASQDGQSHVSFYIQVDDPQAALDRAVTAGASEIMPVTVIPGVVTVAMFAEPTGANVGLVASETPPVE